MTGPEAADHAVKILNVTIHVNVEADEKVPPLENAPLLVAENDVEVPQKTTPEKDLILLTKKTVILHEVVQNLRLKTRQCVPT